MKATTQYGDLSGTAAADRDIDHDFIASFLQDRGVDTNRYKPIGSSFYKSDSNQLSAGFICIDNEKSDGDKEYIVKISFESEITFEEYFNLFHRYEGIVIQNYYKDHVIDDQFMIDDRK